MIETASALVYRVAILFCMMVPGFILRKCKLVTDAFGKGLASFVLYAAQPALVFLAYLQPYDPAILMGMLWVFLYSLLAHAIFIGGALLFFRKTEVGKQKILRLATVFSNAAFMGIPLVGVLMGPRALLYATVYNITYNLVLWSFGVYLCTHDRDHDGNGVQSAEEKRAVLRHAAASILRAVVHPVTVAAVLGLICFVFSLSSVIPPLVTDAFDMLSSTVAPLSMVVIGLRLASADFKHLLKDGEAYLSLLLRHLALPLLVLLSLWAGKHLFPSLSDEACRVVLILASAPVASSVTMLSERYDCDATYAGGLVTVSTALSILTMPLCLLLFGILP